MILLPKNGALICEGNEEEALADTAQTRVHVCFIMGPQSIIAGEIQLQ